MNWSVARAILISVVGVLLLLFLACVGNSIPLEMLFYALVGWVFFLVRVIPQIEVDGESAALGLICLALFTVGLHGFLKWYWHEVRPPQAADGDAPWRARWTAQLTALVLSLFVAGISMVGVTHQIVWMVRSPEPIVSGGREVALRMQSGNNLKHFGIAAHNYMDEKASLPPGYLADEHGLPIHGWITQLLPRLEQSRLYEGIDRSKPWNDPKNREAFVTVLPFTMHGGNGASRNGEGYALTHYAASVDLFGSARAWTYDDVSDGTANTILFGEAGGNLRPWGHPRNVRDLRLGINRSDEGFGAPWSTGGGQFTLADGAVRYLHSKTDPKVLEALATPNAGDRVEGDY